MSERRKMQPLSLSEDEYTMRPRHVILYLKLYIKNNIFLFVGLDSKISTTKNHNSSYSSVTSWKCKYSLILVSIFILTIIYF